MAALLEPSWLAGYDWGTPARDSPQWPARFVGQDDPFFLLTLEVEVPSGAKK
jgi:hypothetical protein